MVREEGGGPSRVSAGEGGGEGKGGGASGGGASEDRAIEDRPSTGPPGRAGLRPGGPCTGSGKEEPLVPLQGRAGQDPSRAEGALHLPRQARRCLHRPD